MINRRKFLSVTAGAGAAFALSPSLLRALQLQQGGNLILRAIPSTGENIPAVGLSFSNHPTCADPSSLKEILKVFADNGGRVYDTMHSNGPSEQFHAKIANELGIVNKLFWSVRGAPPGAGGPPQLGAAHTRAHVETLLKRLNVPKLDLVMVNHQADATQIGALKDLKKERLVRYIGAQTIVDPGYSALEAAMRDEPIDFIGVDYDVGNRAIVEDRILPLAQEKKIGVMAFFPFGNNGGFSCSSGSNLFGRVTNTPLPGWAAEFDAKSWAQFFLKYVISHPAVTVARVGTTKPQHMIDNLGGGIGRLPSEAMRKRMAEFVDALPAAPAPKPPQPQAPPGPTVTLSAAILDRYVGEYKAALGFTAIIRRDGDKLIVKPGNNPEAPLIARTETRFQDPRGPFFEFQVDAQGKVTGAVLEQQGPQGTQRLPLERK
jgi:aryl-alcohol dehydrogenase-like predicted oxidoreductase